MDERYSGYVIYPDGTVVGREGTIQELATWAEQIIRESDCQLTVKIQRVTDKHIKG